MIVDSAKLLTAIAILLDISKHEEPLKLFYVAERQGIDCEYAETIMRKLRVSKLVKTSRGIEGGYYISKKEPILIKDVCLALGISMTPSISFISHGFKRTLEREYGENFLLELNESFVKFFNKNLDDLIKQERES